MRNRLFILAFLAAFICVLIFSLNHKTEPDDRGLKDTSRPLEISSDIVYYDEPHSVPETSPADPLPPSGVTDVLTSTDAAEASMPVKNQDSISGERILRFSDGNELKSFLASLSDRGIKVIDVFEEFDAVRIGFDDPDQLDEVLRSAPQPKEQSGNYYVRLPDKPAQTPMMPSGSYIGFGANSLPWLGVYGNNESWGAGVVVAVLDTGVAGHSALSGVSIEREWIADDSEPKLDVDLMQHGTAMASLIAGTGTEARGVAPSASILSMDVMGADGVSDSFTLAKAIYYAVDLGARVINISMGSKGDSFILKSAVEYAEANDAVVVASAGNDAVEGVLYPARYDSVVAVSGVDAVGRHLYFANRGEEVDISAPALGILAAGEDDGVSSISGTSASAAFVSGAMAVMLSENDEMTAAEAVRILLENADDSGAPGKDDLTGNGVLNIQRIVERNTPGIYDVAVGNPYIERDENGNAVVTLYVQNRGTEPIEKVEFAGVVGNSDYYLDYYNLQVGAVQSYQVLISGDQISSSDSVRVECMAAIDGHSDSRPVNNVVKGSIPGGSK